MANKMHQPFLTSDLKTVVTFLAQATHREGRLRLDVVPTDFLITVDVKQYTDNAS